MNWFIHDGHCSRGPFSTKQIREMLAENALSPDLMVCPPDSTEWRTIRSVPELFADAPGSNIASQTDILLQVNCHRRSYLRAIPAFALNGAAYRRILSTILLIALIGGIVVFFVRSRTTIDTYAGTTAPEAQDTTMELPAEMTALSPLPSLPMPESFSINGTATKIPLAFMHLISPEVASFRVESQPLSNFIDSIVRIYGLRVSVDLQGDTPVSVRAESASLPAVLAAVCMSHGWSLIQTGTEPGKAPMYSIGSDISRLVRGYHTLGPLTFIWHGPSSSSKSDPGESGTHATDAESILCRASLLFEPRIGMKTVWFNYFDARVVITYSSGKTLSLGCSSKTMALYSGSYWDFMVPVSDRDRIRNVAFMAPMLIPSTVRTITLPLKQGATATADSIMVYLESIAGDGTNTNLVVHYRLINDTASLNAMHEAYASDSPRGAVFNYAINTVRVQFRGGNGRVAEGSGGLDGGVQYPPTNGHPQRAVLEANKDGFTPSHIELRSATDYCTVHIPMEIPWLVRD